MVTHRRHPAPRHQPHHFYASGLEPAYVGRSLGGGGGGSHVLAGRLFGQQWGEPLSIQVLTSKLEIVSSHYKHRNQSEGKLTGITTFLP